MLSLYPKRVKSSKLIFFSTSENGNPCAKYFSPLGKKFSSFDEIAQYFNSKNYSVPRHLFKFDIEDEESESDEDDLVDTEEEDEDEEDEITRYRILSL